MAKGSAASKLERLDQLLGCLRKGEATTAQTLASELGVSLRTLMRDLETLKAKGYPIEADKGRGGGVRLHHRWGIGRLSLNYREVIDLLLMFAVIEKLNSPLLLGNLNSIRNKLFASFPDAQRPQIRKIRQRILIGDSASIQVMESFQATRRDEKTTRILESFFDQIRLRIRYKREDKTTLTRDIEVHYLFLNWPVWYLIAYDHYRQAHRTFRIDRVSQADLLTDRFEVAKLSEFEKHLAEYSISL